MIFCTEHLEIRKLKKTDFTGFFDLHRNKKVMQMIPEKPLNRAEAIREMEKILRTHSDPNSETRIAAIILKATNDFIGLCGIIKLKEKEVEIGYRIREQYWRKGFGTEVTEGLINFLFKENHKETIFAEVSKFNIGSNKILSKFMSKINETFNQEDNCIDVHYKIEKKNWR